MLESRGAAIAPFGCAGVTNDDVRDGGHRGVLGDDAAAVAVVVSSEYLGFGTGVDDGVV